MGLRFLEHLLILTHDPDATRDWFVQNLGFREGYHPEFCLLYTSPSPRDV
jgi:catechol 2,3-dioxygenase-like lactoylglutathione lyase family enzyme